MKVVFATNHCYPPQQVGGSESSAHQLCLTLLDRGFDVSVLSRWSWRKPHGSTYLAASFSRPGRQLICDALHGYPVYRARDPEAAAGELVDVQEPDLAVVNSGRPMRLARRFTALGIPTVVYIRDAFFDELGGPVEYDPLLCYVTTSQVLGQKIEEAFGIRPVCIPPVVLPELYRVELQGRNVTFVCPHPKKGLDLALHLADRRPDIPFVFQESWPVGVAERTKRNRRIRQRQNVTLGARTLDMRTVYRDARLILFPTPDFEGWGRAASEAQVSGIPILASDAGGLPEAVGPGGIIVDRNAGIETWAAALARLWDDADEYEHLSELALAHAGRPEFEPEVLATRLISVMEGHAGARVAA